MLFYNAADLVPENENENCTIAELIQHHQLTEDDCSRQVSNQHLVLFSQSHCGQWRMLPAFLGMETTIAEGIFHGPGDDENKRYSFLLKWQQKRGPKATYKNLIKALIKVRCSQDADEVCRVLKKSVIAPSPPPSPPPASSNLSTLQPVHDNVSGNRYICTVIPTHACSFIT